MEIDVPVHFPSKYVLEHMTRRMGFLDEAHSGVGEKYGVRRTWISEELGSDNVVTLCDEAWAKIGTCWQRLMPSWVSKRLARRLMVTIQAASIS